MTRWRHSVYHVTKRGNGVKKAGWAVKIICFVFSSAFVTVKLVVSWLEGYRGRISSKYYLVLPFQPGAASYYSTVGEFPTNCDWGEAPLSLVLVAWERSCNNADNNNNNNKHKNNNRCASATLDDCVRLLLAFVITSSSCNCVYLFLFIYFFNSYQFVQPLWVANRDCD